MIIKKTLAIIIIQLIQPGKEPTKQYTLGFNKFVVGHKLKVQSDLSYTSVNGKDDKIAFRLGFDFHF